MRDLYEAELRRLHESAQEFAEAYPEQAGMLNLADVKDRDPYIERLLEGMAYLTAQIRSHIEDDIPEISETLLNHLWPHFLRPYPSATIMEFEPKKGLLQSPQCLARGTRVMSELVGDPDEGKVQCRFRTTAPVVLNPLRIASLELDEPSGGGTRFRLGFRTDPGIDVGDLDLSALKIHLKADPALALWLHHQLTGGVRRVRVHLPDQPTSTPTELGGQEAVRPAHMDGEDAMVPISGRSFYGFHLLQDYFCFRDRYMFVTLHGLEGVPWPRGCREFEVEILVGGVTPRDHKLSKENFRLHCAPAVNLFTWTAEPIRVDHRRTAYAVVADASVKEGMQVYSVDRVVGIDAERGGQKEYLPMQTFRHRRRQGRFFHVYRRQEGTARPKYYITLGGTKEYRPEMVSVEITATNGGYPRRYLKEGHITGRAKDFPSYTSATNLTRPSRALEPPERERFQWELISHLSLNYSTFTSLDTLRRVLSLYDWSGDEQNRLRIEGLRDIEVEPVERVRRGALMRGLDIRLTLHEDHYLSRDDIHLFGSVLHHFFSMYAVVNCFVQTRVVCHPSNREFTWEPIQGTNSPL